MKLPSEIQPEAITALVDTREQTPWDLSPLRMERASLDTADYTLKGSEHVVRLERKSLPDLIACVGRERDRFDREVQRLLAYPVRMLIVEASWPDIEAGQWRGRVTPNQAIGSLLGWQASGLSIHLAGDSERASKHASRILYTVARRRYRELKQLALT